MTHEEISIKFDITRQAVSHSAIILFDKIKSHFSSDVLNDDNSDKVSEGNEAIELFFKRMDHFEMTKEDKQSLRNILLSNIRKYNVQDIAEKFKNGRYNKYQILSFANKNKLSFCLLRPPKRHKFTEEEEVKIANLYNEGKTAHEIGKVFGVAYNVISGKKGHLFRLGLLQRQKK